MAKLRESQLSEINGVRVSKIEDYLLQEQFSGKQKQPFTDLPKSNVLKYYLADDTWLALRPSGTEPVIKAYVGVNKPDIKQAEAAAQDYQEALAQLLK